MPLHEPNQLTQCSHAASARMTCGCDPDAEPEPPTRDVLAWFRRRKHSFFSTSDFILWGPACDVPDKSSPNWGRGHEQGGAKHLGSQSLKDQLQFFDSPHPRSASHFETPAVFGLAYQSGHAKHAKPPTVVRCSDANLPIFLGSALEPRSRVSAVFACNARALISG